MDQIRLWEVERDRFNFKEGVLYSQFLSQNDFELLRNYARDLGVLVWDNSSKRVMVVSRAGHDDVKRFWKRHRQDH
ncbi:general transcription factor IIH subunit 4-like [Limulus polyphemus]|uniref:General transcription factor IIH subunit 4-like n=1 Tax=Limulus polyphemus TaxID=6850 RepID=A0ABM1BEV4_LIMPO|nr:general transcription factor IIH subunit 4-like [Limulus polyphemus]